MKFELTDTQKDIKKASREFAEKEFDSDLALELEKEGKFPKSIFEKACHLGFIGINYPEEYGGQSFGLFENVLVTEEFCRKDSGVGISLNLADIASGILLRHGDDNQKKKFLLPVTQGKAVSAVAISSLLNGMGQGPVVEENPDEYVLSGEDPFVINGSIADYIIVLCKTNSIRNSKFITVIVKRNQEGVNILRSQKMMGLRMSSVAEIYFNHVRIPKDHLIGRNTEGIEHLKDYLIECRIKTSAQALGIAQGAFDLALKHAREREQFGRKIYQFQGIQFMMAELYTLIEASRSLVYRAACSYDSQSSDLDKISSVAKLFVTDVAVKTAIDSIQIHGGVGLMKEYPVERMLRDAKMIQTLVETNLVQKVLIARDLNP